MVVVVVVLLVPSKLMMGWLDTGWAETAGPALVCETNFGLAPTLDLISLIFLSVNINWSTL